MRNGNSRHPWLSRSFDYKTSNFVGSLSSTLNQKFDLEEIKRRDSIFVFADKNGTNRLNFSTGISMGSLGNLLLDQERIHNNKTKRIDKTIGLCLIHEAALVSTRGKQKII